MSDDLVKRLRVGIHTSTDPLALTNEAADRIEALEAENKALREALGELLHHEIAHVGPFAGQKVVAARALFAKGVK